MGVCATKVDGNDQQSALQSKEVDQKIAEDAVSDVQINKLLLLGAGGSGKSTLFKQMITIYGKGFSDSERRNFISIIHSNIAFSMKTLCEESAKYGKVLSQNETAKKRIMDLQDDDVISSDIGNTVKSLWKDPGIQETYNHRSLYSLNDSAKYYFDRLDEIMSDSYLPTEQDVLRSRAPTTGIVENAFDIDGSSFRMFDVGGQRSERKKWIHCFENVTAVLFVAALSEYNEVLYEDEQKNRMIEAVELFEEIANSEWFEHTSIVLFLNKRDLFAEKLQEVPLQQYFPEYQGTSYDQGVTFVQEMFENRNQQDKDIYTHVTCATDTNNVFAVFTAVKDIIIKKGLARAGLM